MIFSLAIQHGGATTLRSTAKASPNYHTKHTATTIKHTTNNSTNPQQFATASTCIFSSLIHMRALKNPRAHRQHTALFTTNPLVAHTTRRSEAVMADLCSLVTNTKRTRHTRTPSFTTEITLKSDARHYSEHARRVSGTF